MQQQVKSIKMQFCMTLTVDIMMQLYFREVLVCGIKSANEIGSALFTYLFCRCFSHMPIFNSIRSTSALA